MYIINILQADARCGDTSVEPARFVLAFVVIYIFIYYDGGDLMRGR